MEFFAVFSDLFCESYGSEIMQLTGNDCPRMVVGSAEISVQRSENFLMVKSGVLIEMIRRKCYDIFDVGKYSSMCQKFGKPFS